MKWNALAALGAFFLLASGVRGGPIVTLGQKDFNDGDFPGLTTYNAAQAAE